MVLTFESGCVLILKMAIFDKVDYIEIEPALVSIHQSIHEIHHKTIIFTLSQVYVKEATSQHIVTTNVFILVTWLGSWLKEYIPSSMFQSQFISTCNAQSDFMVQGVNKDVHALRERLATTFQDVP